MRTIPLGATAIAVALLAVRPANANGRFPASNQIVFSPTNENVIIGRGTWALLPSTDNGKTWGYLCEDALALPGAYTFQDPEIGLTANNAVVVGLNSPTIGLDVSNDLGCNWNCIGGPLANQQIADLVVRPDSPHQVLVVTSTSNTDAGTTYSQVFQSTDDGATWATLGTPIDPTAVVATIEVAKTDPKRIYVSAFRSYATGRTASLFVSVDNGTTWVEHPVPQFNPSVACPDAPGTQCPTEDELFIAAVDPTDENLVYLRSNGLASTEPGNSRLYVTKDGGQTFEVAKSFALPTQQSSDFLVIGEMLGFALAPDGSKVYVGTRETGLWSASATDLAFTQVNPNIEVQCLAARQTSTGPELWACAPEVSGFVIGKSTDDGVTFTPMMPTITSTNGLISCSPNGTTSDACFTTANASLCSCSGYTNFCSIEINNACFGCGQSGPAPAPLDASAAGSDGDKGPAVPKSSCGCTVVGGGGATGLFAACAIAAMALRRRRTR